MTLTQHPVVVSHGVSLESTSRIMVSATASLITVAHPNELQPALSQSSKAVLIDDAELARKFIRLRYWQDAKWWFIAFLVHQLLTSIIAHQYHLEAEWHLKWKIAPPIDGKIILSPIKK